MFSRQLKEPLLTAEWEHQLKQIELGKISAADFLNGIETMTKDLVSQNQVPEEDFKSLFTAAKGQSVGIALTMNARRNRFKINQKRQQKFVVAFGL